MPNIMITIDRTLLEDCVAALRFKAQVGAGVSSAPHSFSAEDTLEWSQALHIEALLKRAELEQQPGSYSRRVSESTTLGTGFRERADVLAFQQKFNVPMAAMPAFLGEQAFEFRLKFLQEELDEFARDHAAGDMHGAADALIDLAYVLHGTALMMGLPWAALWDEVQRANMAKVRAAHAGESKRGSALDVVKPEGWKAPDHTAALGTGPWPTLETESML